MTVIQWRHVFLLGLLSAADSQRRIQAGVKVTGEKKYVVYLIKASVSPRNYDAWLCGGAIVSSVYVLTSAACIEDVRHLYVVAGYNRYVTDKNIKSDNCIMNTRKKVIYTCMPKAYELVYEQIDKWSYIDIALVKVESPYDFETDKFTVHGCSYAPAPIQVNYEKRFQQPGVDALVLGWGHLQRWRSGWDRKNYNQEYLNYSPVVLIKKSECIKQYANIENMDKVIEKYMICSDGEGNIDDQGESISTSAPILDGCDSENVFMYMKDVCSAPRQNEMDVHDDTRRNISDKHYVYINSTILDELQKRSTQNNTLNQLSQNTTRRDLICSVSKYTDVREPRPVIGQRKVAAEICPGKEDLNGETRRNMTAKEMGKKLTQLNSFNVRTRRNGICQNDHGGPIITWVGAHEVVIGVNSVFRVGEKNKCTGPFLYTSTQCNGFFINCILNDKESGRRAEICDKPPEERGYDLIEDHISWKNHPDGLSENENSSVHPTNESLSSLEQTTIKVKKDGGNLTNINPRSENLNVTKEETTAESNIILNQTQSINTMYLTNTNVTDMPKSIWKTTR